MKTLLWTRNTAVWLLIVGATIVSWQMGHGMGIQDPTIAGVAIMVISMIKIRMVLFDFMELRTAPLAMRWAGDIWIGALGLILCLRFLLVAT